MTASGLTLVPAPQSQDIPASIKQVSLGVGWDQDRAPALAQSYHSTGSPGPQHSVGGPASLSLAFKTV